MKPQAVWVLQWNGLELDRIFHTLSSLGTNLLIVQSRVFRTILCQGRISLSASRSHSDQTSGISQLPYMTFAFLTSSISSLKTKCSRSVSGLQGAEGYGEEAAPGLSIGKWSHSKVWFSLSLRFSFVNVGDFSIPPPPRVNLRIK